MFTHFIRLVNDTHWNSADMTAVALGVMTVANWLPWVSAGLSTIWVALRIYVLIRDEIINKDKKNGHE